MRCRRTTASLLLLLVLRRAGAAPRPPAQPASVLARVFVPSALASASSDADLPHLPARQQPTPSELYVAPLASVDLRAALHAAAPDVFASLPRPRGTGAGPPGLQPGLASPCWEEPAAATSPASLAAGRLRCLPLAYLLGASESDTANLHRRLARHARFVAAPNSAPRFWDGGGSGGGFAGYTALFDPLAAAVRGGASFRGGEGGGSGTAVAAADGVPVGGAGLVSADASPSTFAACGVRLLLGGRAAPGRAPPQPQQPGHPNATVAALLAEAAPYARLVMLLRDPAERFVAEWWGGRDTGGGATNNATGGGTAGGGLDGAVRAALRQWDRCVVREGPGGEPACAAAAAGDAVAAPLAAGLHALHVPCWGAAAFPPGALLVLRSEDVDARPKGALAAVFRHLGLAPPATGAAWARVLGGGRAHAAPLARAGAGGAGAGGLGGAGGGAAAAVAGGGRGVAAVSAAPAPPPPAAAGGAAAAAPAAAAALARLRAFYSPWNARLAAQLGDDRFRWGY